MNRYIAVLGSLFYSINLWAGQWVGPFEVGSIEVNEEEVFFVSTEGFPNNENCRNDKFIKFEAETAKNHNVYSVALAAKSAGKGLSFYIDGCAGSHIRATALKDD